MENKSTLLVNVLPIPTVSSSHEEIVAIMADTIPISSNFLIIEVLES
jgi:hypothetical protein